jgi:hypothetical protein
MRLLIHLPHVVEVEEIADSPPIPEEAVERTQEGKSAVRWVHFEIWERRRGYVVTLTPIADLNRDERP